MDSTSSSHYNHAGNLKRNFDRAASKSDLLSLMMLAALIGGPLALIVPGASADAPPGPYFNGFETDTAGWFNSSGATITRVPSGSSSTYANGVSAATGNFYARLGKDPSPDSCTFGGGIAPIF